MNADEFSRRAAYIATDLALAMPFTTQWVEPATWDTAAFIEGAGVHYPMGFTPPVPIGRERYQVFACADVLIGQTEDMDPTTFFAYSASVRTHLLLHMVSAGEGHVGGQLESAVLEAQRGLDVLDLATFERVWARVIR